MTDNTQTPLEKAARALAAMAGPRWTGDHDKPEWQDFVGEARAVLMAVREDAALRAAGADWMADHGSEAAAIAASDMDSVVRYIDAALGE